jgi:hypothetical protein
MREKPSFGMRENRSYEALAQNSRHRLAQRPALIAKLVPQESSAHLVTTTASPAGELRKLNAVATLAAVQAWPLHSKMTNALDSAMRLKWDQIS